MSRTDAFLTSFFGVVQRARATAGAGLLTLTRLMENVYAMRMAMFVNEFLKEHHHVQEREATTASLKSDFELKFAQQQKQIEALASGLQKVTARFEAANSLHAS